MSAIRCAVPGYPHHIRVRGVRREPLFYDDSDYLVYIRNLKDGCAENSVNVTTYTLMTNHVHVIAIPEEEESISRALHHAHTNYAHYFNPKYGYRGHLFDRRPYYNAMDEAHMWNAVRYVERNPVRAGLVARAEDYLWSSAAAHCGLRNDILIDPLFPPLGAMTNWSEWLRIDNTEEDRRVIRLHLSTGLPWADPEFLLQFELITGRSLRPQKRGRPRKTPPGRALFEK